MAPKPRPFNHTQALQNAAFLAALRRTGNVREAARSLGLHRAMFTRRRAKHPAFAADWDAALALALAHAHVGKAAARRARARAAREARAAAAPESAAGAAPPTQRQPRAEPQVVRTSAGRLQLRAPPRRSLTRADEQTFLLALSATANVRLAAQAAGFSHSAFYHRRKVNPAFAREMRFALQIGYDRVEGALIEGYDPLHHRDDAWRSNAVPTMPSMTADQALQLLHLHHKTCRLWAEHPAMRRRPYETRDQMSARLGLQWRAQCARDAEERALAEAEGRWHAGEAWHPKAPLLPDLDQVQQAMTARSEGTPPLPRKGGWKIGDWE